MPYYPKPNGVNPTLIVSSTLIPGSYLARNKLGLIERAFIAADLHLGAKDLVSPTQIQSAALSRVNHNYVYWAVKRYAERADIERGLVPLIPPQGEPATPKTNGTTTSGIDDSSLVQLVRSVGIDRVIHAAIAVERAQH